MNIGLAELFANVTKQAAMSPHVLSFYSKFLAGTTKAMTLCGNKVSQCTSHFDNHNKRSHSRTSNEGITVE